MQKKLMALAVASMAASVALAQTNVTLYGVADAGYVHSSGDAAARIPGVNTGSNEFSGIQSGLLTGSQLGVRGEEALGNGLKAIFTLEYQLSIDSNSGVGFSTGSTSARQQFVGLSSATLGTLALGRQYAPGYQATKNNAPLFGASFESQSYLSAQAGNTITPTSNGRWDNAVTYLSPNWGGFTGKAIYSFGETAATVGGVSSYNDKLTDITANQKWGVGFNDANGLLKVDLVYQSRMNTVGSATKPYPAGTNKDINEGDIGASYDFKVVKIMGSYQRQSDKNATNRDNGIWSLGAVIPVLPASNIHLAYAQLDWDQGNCYVGISHACGLTGSTKSATLAWTTALSKRTTLYAGYVWNDNDKNTALTATGGSAGPVAGIGAVNQTNQTILGGIRHTF